MIVLDSYAVLALLKGEAGATAVRRLLQGNEPVQLTTLGVAEVIDHLVRLCGATEDDAALDLAQLGLAEGLTIDAIVGLRAGVFRARHYHRRDCAVSLADCVAAAVADSRHATLASADAHLLSACLAEGIGVLALPDSNGYTWHP